VILAALLAQSTAAAEQPSAEDIVVTAKLPDTQGDSAFGAYDLDIPQVALVPRQAVETLLFGIPSAQQFRRSDSRSSNPSAQGLTLRALGGNAAARTLVLRDGVPVMDPFFGSVPFNSLQLATIERIRVTPGVGAGPFGGGAIAGVVEIESSPIASGNSPNVSIGRGSFNTLSGSATLYQRLGGGGVRMSAIAERSDGFFTTPVSQRVLASVPARYRHGATELAASVPTGLGRLDARVSLFKDSRTLRFAGANSSSEGIDFSIRWAQDSVRGADFEASAWLQMRDFSTIAVSASTYVPVLDQRATPTLAWGAKLEVRPIIDGARTLRLGLDFRVSEGRTDEVGLAASGAVTLRRQAGGRSSLFGAFVEHDVRVGALIIGAGLRVDQWLLTEGQLQEANGAGTIFVDQNYANRRLTLWTARSAASLLIAPDLHLRMSAYRGFRVPTLNELYRPFVVFPVLTRANASLSPERLTGLEGAIAYGPASSPLLSLTAFANRVQGAIVNLSVAPNLRVRTNVPALRSYGIEFRGHYAFGQFSAVQASIGYAEARVDGGTVAPALDGLRPAQAPRWSASGAVFFEGPGPTRNVVMIRHGGQQFEDDRNADVLPAYTVLDLSSSLDLGGGLTLTASAENITGTRIVTRNSGGSVDLGAPRAWRLTLRWN
jgi:outer membrane receptor protein involved in Fe transport